MIDCIFNPKSVAVIGATDNSSKWGNWISEDLLKHKHIRNVYLIKQNQLISDIPEPLYLAVVCVPVAQFETVIDQLLEHGTKAIIGITTGFSEKGEQELEQRIIDKVRAKGSILIGPNCAGIWDAYSPIHCLPIGDFNKGEVGVISQSGGVIVDLANRLKEVNVGYSRVISTGNQNGIELKDLIENLANDQHTKVIAMYCEDVKKIPFEYINTVQKPIILFVPWATPAAIRAAKNHTNSDLTIALNVARNMMDFTAAIQFALSNQSRPKGRRTMLVSDTGGFGVIMSTSAEFNGLLIDEPSDTLKEQLRQVVSKQSTISNPIDLVGSSAGFTQSLVDVMNILQKSDEVDNIIMNIHLETEDSSGYMYGSLLAQEVMMGKKATIFTCFRFNTPGVKALLDWKMPVYRDADVAAAIMSMICN